MINTFEFKGNPEDVQGRVTVVSFLEEAASASCPKKITTSVRGFFATFNLGHYIEKFEPAEDELRIAKEIKRKLILSLPQAAQVVALYRKCYDIDKQEIELLPEDMMIAGHFTNPDEAKKTVVIAANTYLKMYSDQNEGKIKRKFARACDFENRSIRKYVLDTFVWPYAEVCGQPVSVQSSNRAIELESGIDFFVKGSLAAEHGHKLMNLTYLSDGRLSSELIITYTELIDSIHLMRFEESAVIRDKILKLEGKPAFRK